MQGIARLRGVQETQSLQIIGIQPLFQVAEAQGEVGGAGGLHWYASALFPSRIHYEPAARLCTMQSSPPDGTARRAWPIKPLLLVREDV